MFYLTPGLFPFFIYIYILFLQLGQMVSDLMFYPEAGKRPTFP